MSTVFVLSGDGMSEYAIIDWSNVFVSAFSISVQRTFERLPDHQSLYNFKKTDSHDVPHFCKRCVTHTVICAQNKKHKIAMINITQLNLLIESPQKNLNPMVRGCRFELLLAGVLLGSLSLGAAAPLDLLGHRADHRDGGVDGDRSDGRTDGALDDGVVHSGSFHSVLVSL